MRKLNFLSSLVDLIWYLTIISLPFVLIFFIGGIFFMESPLETEIKVGGILLDFTSDAVSRTSKIFVVILLIPTALLVMSLYHFRKILFLFRQTKIFDNEVITRFNKIGQCVVISAVISGICKVIYPAVVFYDGVRKSWPLQIGTSSDFLCLTSIGLFCFILAQVFKIAKNMKEENELTV